MSAEATEVAANMQPAPVPTTDGAATPEAVKKGRPKAEVEKVTMEDGRVVEFAGKRKMIKNSLPTSEGRWDYTRFDFRDGRSIIFKNPGIDLKIDTEGEYLFDKLASHGLEQKLGDETAGKTASISDMYDAVSECAERLTKGEWYAEGAGEGAFGTTNLLKALVEFTGKTREVLQPWLKSRSPDERKALRNAPKIRPIIQRLEDEEAAKTAHVDTDALLGSLEAGAVS